MALSDNTAEPDISISRENHNRCTSNTITPLHQMCISLIVGKGVTPAGSRRVLELCVCVWVGVYKRQDLTHCRQRGTPATIWQPIMTVQRCLSHSTFQLLHAACRAWWPWGRLGTEVPGDEAALPGFKHAPITAVPPSQVAGLSPH